MTMEAARRPSSWSNQSNVKAAQTPDQSTISTANARLIFYLKRTITDRKPRSAGRQESLSSTT